MIKTHVYDIETLPNIFCLVAKDISTKQIYTFEISCRVNQIDRLIKYLSSGLRHIGYNNLAFDYPVIHWLLNNYRRYKSTDELIFAIHEYANYIISLDYSAVRDRDVRIAQLDLYKIWHFDNKAKATSLKALEIAIRMETVQDLPFGSKEEVPLQYFDDVINYCINDVEATYKFYLESKNEIKLRQDISREYGINLLNANDPKMGEQIFLDELSKEMGVNKWDLKQMRTYVSKLEFRQYVLESIKFQTPELNTLLNKIKAFVTTDTKGSFHYSAKLGDFTIDYGQGGLHGCIEPGIYESTEDKVILDLDVASFYPNLAIVNNIRPRHLGEAFSKIYEKMYYRRKSIPKSDSRNYALKIALNGSFGKMNDENSFLYDPEALLKITLNGQLSLSMLMETIYLTVPVVFLQGNTDGFTIQCNRSDVETIQKLTKEWEEYTELEMEFAEYSKMVIRDVNNYLAVYNNGKVKYKGAFEIDRAWHKNHSMRIVPLALSEYFIKNIPIITTIDSHLEGKHYSSDNPNKPIKNYGILDFCKRGRVTGKNKLVARDGKLDNPLQKNNRYYIANKGVDLIKIMPALRDEDGTLKADKLKKYRKQNPNQLDMFHFIDDVLVEKDRETNLEVGYKCELFNTIENVDYHSSNINKEYYIKECYKIIDVIGS